MRRRVQRAPLMHAAETCCAQCAAARSRIAEGSSVVGSLHAANDNPAGDDRGSNEAGNSEVMMLSMLVYLTSNQPNHGVA